MPNYIWPMLLFFFAATLLPQEARPDEPYRYTVRFGAWDGQHYESLKNIPVELDGKVIGYPGAAFSVLDRLSLKKGDRIKLETQSPNSRKVDVPFFLTSSFLYHWMEKGARIDYYEDGKRLPFHILTWSDFIVNGEFVESMDDAVWEVDGKRIGNGVELNREIDRWLLEPGVVVVALRPVDWNMASGNLPRFEGTGFSRLQDLGNEKKIRFFMVQSSPKERDVQAESPPVK